MSAPRALIRAGKVAANWRRGPLRSILRHVPDSGAGFQRFSGVRPFG